MPQAPLCLVIYLTSNFKPLLCASLYGKVAPGMMPHFPPGLFPFWGPFPGAAPPAGGAPAAQAAADSPQTGSSTSQAPGQGEECRFTRQHISLSQLTCMYTFKELQWYNPNKSI